MSTAGGGSASAAWSLFGGEAEAEAEAAAAGGGAKVARASAHAYFAASQRAPGRSRRWTTEEAAEAVAEALGAPRLSAAAAALRGLGHRAAARAVEARRWVEAVDELVGVLNAAGWDDGGACGHAFLLARAALAAEELERGEHPERCVRAAIQLLDHAATLGERPEFVDGLLAAAEAEFRRSRRGAAADAEPGGLRMPVTPPLDTPTVAPERAVERVDARGLSAAAFANAYLRRRRPVVLEGHLHAQQWSALDDFADLAGLIAAHGDRCVPVELDDGSTPCVLSLRELARGYLQPSIEHDHATVSRKRKTADCEGPELPQLRVAYMCQHTLFHQVPELQDAIAVPDYCMGRITSVNGWLGTRGTVTSLHTDEADNVLCQVAGYKYVRLFAPSESNKLYPETRPGNAQTNRFSPVDAEAPDLERHPLAATAAYAEAVLGPGDILFLPAGTWHHVRSLTTSASVNFWF